jgi:predicted glycosyltransferase
VKVWVDFLTPKQAYLLGVLCEKLESAGHDVFKTTRKYREVNEALKRKDIEAVIIGGHGGASLRGKLIASADRIVKLAKTVSKRKIDVSIAFASPEASRTAFGLGISHYTINDSPHSKAVAVLTVPLSKKLFTPKIIPLKKWTGLGITLDRIVQYNALDPIAWLRNFKPNDEVLQELGLEASKPIVVFRVEEAQASYLFGKVSEKTSILTPVIKKLVEKHGKQLQIVVLPRYRDQTKSLKAIFRNKVVIPEKFVDGPSLLHYSSVFVGAGGTMTAEAALLGVPVLSCYPSKPTIIEDFLIRNGFVFRLKGDDEVLRKLNQILQASLRYKQELKEKAQRLRSSMEDPVEVIFETLCKDFA